MEFEEGIRSLGRKAANLEPTLNEEGTKMALVAPFIRALGYDVFNPEEVVPEYTASTGALKDARADYAIMKNGEAFAVIECKALGVPLDAKKTQLEWYFVNSPARIGILTDGNRYIFFSDLDEKNKMDKAPFLDFCLTNINDTVIARLIPLCKSKFDPEKYLQEAEKLKFSSEFKRMIAKQFESPDDKFTKLFVAPLWNGYVMQSVIDRFRPILKSALDMYINEVINDRLEKAKAPSQIIDPDQEITAEKEQEKEDNKIVTTPDEWQAFYLTKSLLIGTVDLERVFIRDCVNFCNVLLDDSQFRPIVRFLFNSKPYKIGFFDTEKKKDTVEIEKIDDIIQYADRIRAAAKKYDT